MSPLQGKVAFITGGGSGIGRGIALRLARDGADIFLADIDAAGAESTVDLVNQLGRKAAVCKANVAAPAQIAEAAATCVQQFGRLDIAGLVSFMCGPDGGFMSGSYVIMDGGLRDARAVGQQEPAVAQEMQRILARSEARRAQQQGWLDERD